MPFTVLELAQAFCEENGLPVPAALSGSGDAGALQLRQLINKVGKEALRFTNWQVVNKRVTWTSSSGEDQGDITTLIGEDLGYVIPETFWDNTLRRPIFGPVSDKEWQALKALVPTSPLYQFRIAENHLFISGPMVAGHELSLIYKSIWWVKIAGTNPQQWSDSVTSDSDTMVFPDDLMQLGLLAFWRKAKELEYAQEMSVFKAAAVDLGSTDKIRPIIDMGGGERQIKPGIWVPAGNWDQTPP